MAWKLLPVDYTDAVWSGLKRYSQIANEDGTVSFQDVTQYSNKEKSFFGALDANRMNEALNTIMSMVENGTDLYEAFQIYFADQKDFFKVKVDSEYALFVKYLTDLEDEGFTSMVKIANQAEHSAIAAKISETKALDSAIAAKISETNSYENVIAADAAQNAAESARVAAEIESARAKQSTKESSDILEQNKIVAVRTPYVGENGNWFVWSNLIGGYTDSGVQAKGEKGEQGAKGEKGEQGVNGIAVAADGIFAFNVNEKGHLILSYADGNPPDFSINEKGHLIYNY